MRIRTIKIVLIAFSAMGFGLFTAPVLGNLYLKQQYGLDAFRRGLIGTIGISACSSRSPSSVATTTASTAGPGPSPRPSSARWSCPCAVIVPIQYFMPNAVLWAVSQCPGAVSC